MYMTQIEKMLIAVARTGLENLKLQCANLRTEEAESAFQALVTITALRYVEHNGFSMRTVLELHRVEAEAEPLLKQLHLEVEDRLHMQSAAELLADPAASHWLKSALGSALERDPVDAANDVDVLDNVLRARAMLCQFQREQG